MKPKMSEVTSTLNVETRTSRERRKSFGISEVETMRETFYRMGMMLKCYDHRWSKSDIKLFEQTMRLLK